MKTIAWVATATFVLVLRTPAAIAGCNAIPEIPPAFIGVRGSVDRPFIRAGQRDVLTVDVPRAEDRAVASVSDVDITLFIKSVGAPEPRPVFIPGDGKCDSLREPPCSLERFFCHVEPDCLDPGPAGADVQLLQTPNGARVSFRFPPSRRVGPLTVVVTATQQRAPLELANRRCRDVLDRDHPLRPDLLACIDDIIAITPGNLTDGALPTPGPTPTAQPLAFTQLLALSSPNDFQQICYDDAGDLPHCTGTASTVSMTLDSDGNLVIPMRWTNILRPKGGPYQRRQVRCSSAIEPFSSPAGGRIVVPGKIFLEPWSLNGTQFGSQPVFEAQQLPDRPNELTLFGTTDKDDSVLRIWRRRVWGQACTDSAAQACEPATASVDCSSGATCAAVAPAYYVCSAGTRSGLPCTRPSHCPGGQCNAGSRCITIATGAATAVTCTTDAQCQSGEECGSGLFEFRNRATNGAITVPRSVAKGFQSVCDGGKNEGAVCKSSLSCSPFLFGSASCVAYRAEAILFSP